MSIGEDEVRLPTGPGAPPLPSRRVPWTELLGHPEVSEVAVARSRVGFMAFHGGLEAGTAEIAEVAAGRSGASLYVVRQPAALRWHVPSHQVDPAGSGALAGWLDHVDLAVALHGYGRVGRPRRILVGGSNRVFAGFLARHLAPVAGFEVVDDLGDVPPELRGLHPDNPVNRPRLGGVQVELPPSARWATAAEEVVAALSRFASEVVLQLPAEGDGGHGGPGGGRGVAEATREGHGGHRLTGSQSPLEGDE